MTLARALSHPLIIPALICLISALASTTSAHPSHLVGVHAKAATSVLAPASVNAYPPRDAVPPTNSPEVLRWLKELDLSGAPTFKINRGEPPECPTNLAPEVCYWTCQNCASDDVVSCPEANVWGLTFDDGPSEATPGLLDFLKNKGPEGSGGIKATFFLIGSNVVQHPETVKAELAQGHHIASHTWSHHALTTLTNEQIVAEIKWTEKAIEDVTGYRVKYVRPPYGDIDDRVRFVLRKMGYIVVDWTSDAFDTNDWKIPMKQASIDSVQTRFKTSLARYANATASPAKKGFISLEHDLAADTVAVAKVVIPFGLQKKLIIQSVAQCLHDTTPYSAINGVPTTSGQTLPGTASAQSGGQSGNQNGAAGVLETARATVATNTGSSRTNIRGQHFLGRFFASPSASSTSSSEIHSALRMSKWWWTAEKVAWSGLVLGSYVVGMASL